MNSCLTCILHITRDGVLRIGLGAHQEHRVNHVARATDRTKVSADVFFFFPALPDKCETWSVNKLELACD